jgi:hypothetical protein
VSDRSTQIRNLQTRFEKLMQRVETYRSNIGTRSGAKGFQLLDTVEAQSIEQYKTLDKLKAQLAGGSSFLSKFTLWLSGRNAAAMERLMDRAEEEIS